MKKQIIEGLFIVLGIMAVAYLLATCCARAHEHQAGESTQQAAVVEFYRTWHRPKGEFSVVHRQASCCWSDGPNQDCFPVGGRKVIDGVEWLTPDVSEASTQAQLAFGGRWWPNKYHTAEDEQVDPRESPDGRSHMCVTGDAIICYVRGWGQ